MPYILKPNKLFVKDPEGTGFLPQNVVSDQPTFDEITVSGSTPTINALKDTMYLCGTVSSISFTPSSEGLSAVRFTSGTTPAVLAVPNTVVWPEWFDPNSLSASTTYEINVHKGVYGVVGTWQ